MGEYIYIDVEHSYSWKLLEFFLVDILSKGQSKYIECKGGGQLSLTEEQGILAYKDASKWRKRDFVTLKSTSCALHHFEMTKTFKVRCSVTLYHLLISCWAGSRLGLSVNTVYLRSITKYTIKNKTSFGYRHDVQIHNCLQSEGQLTQQTNHPLQHQC